MKRLFIILSSIILVIVLVTCNKNIIDDTQNKSMCITGRINTNVSYDECQLSTVLGDTLIDGNAFKTNILANNCVQTFLVNDNDNVYLMSRNTASGDSEIEMNAHSTALAMITMYPLFSPTESSSYGDLVSYIESSEKFTPFYKQVEQAVNDRRNLYDENNEELLMSFNDLIEDLCSDISEEAYDDTLITFYNSEVLTRAAYESPRLDPTYIKADITGNKLTLRTVGLTPSYYGSVTNRNGSSPLALKSRSDFGGMDLFMKTASNWRYGDPMSYSFTCTGEHRFFMSRMTAEATADFYLRLANSILTSLGLDLGNDAVQEIGNSISRAMINAGSGVSDDVIDPMEWIGIAYNATLEQLKTGRFFGIGITDSFIYGAKFLSGALNWYNKIKGVGNAATRLAYAIKAPEQFNFCLCYYDSKVTTCSQASLELISGDNQTGYPKQKLLEPLMVYVTTMDENGYYTDAADYHQVKFEVSKGGGSVENDLVTVEKDNTASTYWTLGESGSQEVKAVVIDVITGKEISNPVYFTAEMEKAEITIRLDWSQHSGDTDIDLHVIDPNGERICYYQMSSSSGGYLDRDDRHGPGPEHIHWDNAIPGKYKIYVHYYPNDDEDKSVVSYKVTVKAEGKSYRPASGSIGYDQMIPIGQFTIGEDTKSSTTLENKDNDNIIENPHLPKK